MALSVAEASAQILSRIRPLTAERVPLRESLGRVLASDVRSPIAHPPWANASMDGYAVRAEDIGGATPTPRFVLPVRETVRAGQAASTPLAPHTAIRIMTGAPVPAGADTVVRVEDTDAGEELVSIREARDAGKNVRPRGEDLQPGDLAVSAGTWLGPAHLGVLASVGAAVIDVYRRPRVAVLTSGDELVDVAGFDAVLRGERIVSSNSYTLSAAATDAGADVVDLGIAGDDPSALAARLRDAQGCDLLVTSGGVSVGAFDFTKDVLRDLGAELHLWRVAMRPGAPVGFGTLHGTPWLGLPGNPVSSLVTFELVARPGIPKHLGLSGIFRRAIDVVAREMLRMTATLPHFVRGVVDWDGGVAHARLTGPQGSGILTSMARANALLVVPADRPVVAPGETVRALLLADEALAADTLQL